MSNAQRKGERTDRRRTRRISRIVCIVSAKLLSEARRTRRPSRRLETDLRDDESGPSDNNFAQANQIDPVGKQVCTSESDRPVQTTSSHERIRSTRPDKKFARANQIDPFGQQVCTSESDRPVRTTSLHERIISTPPDNKFARANQIDPFGQQVRTSELYQPARTTSLHEQIRSTLSDNKSVQANQIAPDCSDGHRTVNFGYSLQSSRRSDG